MVSLNQAVRQTVHSSLEGTRYGSFVGRRVGLKGRELLVYWRRRVCRRAGLLRLPARNYAPECPNPTKVG
jgi:hypothetical protein